MKRRSRLHIWIALSAACLLLACSPAGKAGEDSPIAQADGPDETTSGAVGGAGQDVAAQDSVGPLTQPQPIDVRFQDVLNQYMGLNERLDRIASRLKTANADICAETEADIGITTHTLSDYPEELRPAARYYLNVGSDMSIRTVRAGSPAAAAGLLSGDRIAALNGESLIDGPLFSDPRLKGAMGKALFHTSLNKLAAGETAKLTLRRNDRAFTENLPITQQCRLPVTLFFSDAVNGHYIDGEIWMTSSLLQEISEDVRVAYIMAHEMAHALRHETGDRTPEIELDADRIGLILLARAGYDPASLAQFWAEQLYLSDGGSSSGQNQASASHPDLTSRADNFALTLSYIRAARGDKDKLKALISSSAP
jgi:Zn-dependent protease with chaperone function